MTNKLFYSDVYTRQWQTKITRVIEREEGIFALLEETAFYPHGGGQPSDTGTINGIPVLDVFNEDGEVFHQLERIPSDLHAATCELNWSRRYDHMQHHSGQHLLSAVCLQLFGSKTMSFHLGKDDCSIDVDGSLTDSNKMADLEKKVNEQIYQNRKIHSYFVTNDQLKELTLVKMPKVTENIRIVEIEGIEFNACGGTHVSRTGEIGIIKILKAEKQKDFTRIYFKCGNRALEDFNEALGILGALSKKFNTGRNDILDRFEKWQQNQTLLEAEIAELKEKNDFYLAAELLSQIDNGVLSYIFEDKSLRELQTLAARLAAENDIFILFASLKENKLVMYQNGFSPFSCGKFFKQHLSQFSGKGGGNDKSAQAGFPSSDAAVKFLEFSAGQLKDTEGCR
ncbi:alanyl-tRNA editing protein [Bacillus sp. MUM 13]|uniref:alanyl-tRNA editing protein n=1 Tax=Bacillus sp. MUM 13 TaxID=1678001 RepID=UPI0008F59C49|nr:alanyl-tRNA editing protein [Bacillus sp. MUM 13]OIK09016.1 hydrolase [Bacillus sp. MUM 13]